MADITTWIKTDLFPSLWDRMDDIFPEREFRRKGGTWISPTYLNGDKANRLDKSWISNKTPWLLHEQGENETRSLVDCYMDANGLSFSEAIKALSQVAGIKAPQGQDWDYNRWKQDKEEQSLREAAQDYFTWCLFNAESEGAREALSYLKEERKYTEAEIKEMGLGYIPSQEQLRKKLTSLGYTEQEINNTLHFNGWIGKTHKISIPFVCSGDIVGFDFRQVGSAPILNSDGNEIGKYQFESGVEKKAERFFNISSLRGEKDLVVVEGELDCLAASVRGFKDFVALGGNTSINAARVAHAIKMGAKSFTILLDWDGGTDKQGRSKEDIKRANIDKAVSTILQAGCDKIYIASFPTLAESPGKTDADTLLKYQGEAALRGVVEEAQVYWSWRLDNIFDYYAAKEEEGGRGTLTEKQTDALLDSMVEAYDTIPSPMDKDRFATGCKKVFEALGIQEHSFSEVVEAFNKRRKEREKSKELTKALSNIPTLLQSNPSEVEGYLRKTLQKVEEKGTATDFAHLTEAPSWEDIKEACSNAREGLHTGYYFGEKEWKLRAAALSILAAQTHHGKTSFLLNIALNTIQDNRYNGKKVVYLSYEQTPEQLYQRLLNIHISHPLNASNSSNNELLEEYFRIGAQPQYMRREGYDILQRMEKEFVDAGYNRRIVIIQPRFTIDTLANYIKYLGQRDDIALVIVDYFQLLQLPTEYRFNGSRQEQLKRICLELNEAAQVSQLPILLAAQFNREVVNVNKLLPTNLREAADIEQIADALVGLWNTDFKQEFGKGDDDGSKAARMVRDNPHHLYCEILKSRLIGIGETALLEFDGNTGKIKRNLPKESTLLPYEDDDMVEG